MKGFDHMHAQGRQRGVALVVSLMLLIVVALVGLASIRGTTMQQKMATNSYDREQAFQAAEAAMRVATALLASNPGLIARNCQIGGTICPGNPFTDPNLPATRIHNVDISATSSTQFQPGATAATNSSGGVAPPQYVIELMGNYTDPSGIGNNSANMTNYGVQGKGASAIYYRITARSADPAIVGDRAVVTLQANIKQG